MASPKSPRRSTESLDLLSPTPPQSQYPFPIQNDWGNRPSSTGGRYQPRRGSTASSIHSVGGVLDSGFKNNMGAVREQNQNGGYLRASWDCKTRKIAG
jgi:vacuolar protein sorting-associated protein 54